MKKKREILTHPLSLDRFWEEFRYFSTYFREKGIDKCHVLFGFAWGNDYYPEKNWVSEEMPFDELENKILDMERQGFGNFGHNDVFVKVAGVEFRFCNDTDIHISYESHLPLIEDFYCRWESLGYYPAEWLKNDKSGSGQLIRGGKPVD